MTHIIRIGVYTNFCIQWLGIENIINIGYLPNKLLFGREIKKCIYKIHYTRYNNVNK